MLDVLHIPPAELFSLLAAIGFAAGLNLYYAVQNLASIPQQWLVVKERMTMQGKMTPAVVVSKRKS